MTIRLPCRPHDPEADPDGGGGGRTRASACSAPAPPRRCSSWQAWHAQDPAAAEAFLAEPAAAVPRAGGSAGSEPTGQSVWDQIAYVRVGRQLGDQPGQRLLRRPADARLDVAQLRRRRVRPDAPTRRSREQQIVVAERILADVGYGAWPACSRQPRPALTASDSVRARSAGTDRSENRPATAPAGRGRPGSAPGAGQALDAVDERSSRGRPARR